MLWSQKRETFVHKWQSIASSLGWSLKNLQNPKKIWENLRKHEKPEKIRENLRNYEKTWEDTHQWWGISEHMCSPKQPPSPRADVTQCWSATPPSCSLKPNQRDPSFTSPNFNHHNQMISQSLENGKCIWLVILDNFGDTVEPVDTVHFFGTIKYPHP